MVRYHLGCPTIETTARSQRVNLKGTNMTLYYDPTTAADVDLPQRWQESTEIRGDWCPAGVFTDWQSEEARELVYRLRTSGARPTHRNIALAYGFQHWLFSYRAQDCQARRLSRDTVRGRAEHAGSADNRSWSTARHGREASEVSPTRPNSRGNTSLVSGMFGIEIEFNRRDNRYSDEVRRDAVATMVAQGIAARVVNYEHTVRPYWKMTTDATVTGGECVSPILAGDTASLDEVRDVIKAIKDAGGITRHDVGMHIHHNVMDFTTPEMRNRLVNTLESTQHALSQYVMQERISNYARCGATLSSGTEFDAIRRSVRHMTPGQSPNASQASGNSGSRYRFFNIDGPMHKYGSVEFRGLGGTLHAGKVRVWVRMGQAVIEHARLGHTMPMGLTPEGLVDELRSHNLLGRKTGERFLAEVTRRQVS